MILKGFKTLPCDNELFPLFRIVECQFVNFVLYLFILAMCNTHVSVALALHITHLNEFVIIFDNCGTRAAKAISPLLHNIFSKHTA